MTHRPLPWIVAAAVAALSLSLASPTPAGAQEVCALPLATTSGVVQLSLAFDQTLVAAGDDDAVLMVEVRGAEDGETVRTPVSMAVVIDVSGSMAGEKIDHAKEAASRLVDRLAEGDLLTLIVYDTSARTLLSNYAISNDNSSAQLAIHGIGTGGNTCVSCGLDAAFTALESAPHAHLRRVVMLSDGNANRGVTDSDGLRERASGALERSRTVTSTIGLGTDYNEDLLAAISVGGTGAYYFLPDGAAMAGILDRELAALERTVATELAISVTPGDGVTLGETEAVGARRDGDGLVFNLGQLAAGEVRRFLVPLTLPAGNLGEVVRAVAGFRPVGGEVAEIQLAGRLERTDEVDAATASRNSEVIAQQERLASVAEIDTAMRELRGGDTGGARARLTRRAAELEAQAGEAAAPALAEEAAAVRALADALEEEPDADEARTLYLQNQARGNEVRQGVDAEQMYHLDTVH